MLNISLDSRLKKDCHILGCLDNTLLLLMKNALFPWFVLVPDTDEIELYKLDHAMQLVLLNNVTLVCEFVEANYEINKMNIAAIGNIVSQLHVHIVGRARTDVCWPGVVWGTKEFKAYEQDQVEDIKSKISASLSENFQAYTDS